jgi:hypothetical protein
MDLGLGLVQLGLLQRHLLIGDHLVLEQLLAVIELNLHELGLGQLGIQFRLVKSWYDLVHDIALFHRLAFLDDDVLEIPVLQGTDIDVTARVDLADVLLGDGDVRGRGAGDYDLMMLLIRPLLLVHVAGRQGEGNQRQTDGENP